MNEIVCYTPRTVKLAARRWYASAGPPPACSSPSSSSGRILGYRHLAKLVIAIELHALVAANNNEPHQIAQPVTV